MEAQCATLTNATLQLLLQKKHDSGPRLFLNLTGIFVLWANEFATPLAYIVFN